MCYDEQVFDYMKKADAQGKGDSVAKRRLYQALVLYSFHIR